MSTAHTAPPSPRSQAFSTAIPVRPQMPDRGWLTENKIILVLAGVVAILGIAVLIAVAVKASPGFTAGSSGGQQALSGTVTGSGGLRLSYEITSNSHSAIVRTTIEGKPAHLGVIFTKPKGEPYPKIIEKEDMVTGRVVISFRLDRPDPGDYAIEVKDADSGDRICKKEFALSLGELKVTDVKLKFKSGESYRLEGVDVCLHKTGNLPLHFYPVSAFVNGKQLGSESQSCGTMAGSTHTVEICQGFFDGPLLKKGEECLVEAALFYGEGEERCLRFTKKIVVQ